MPTKLAEPLRDLTPEELVTASGGADSDAALSQAAKPLIEKIKDKIAEWRAFGGRSW